MKPVRNLAYLVGAGPGDPGLITLKARQLIERADVIIYDALVNTKVLQWAREGVRLVDAGKRAARHTLSQDEINAILVEETRAGRMVVRLKGGDPFVFGRGGEEAAALLQAGLAYEIVPGITAGVAAPAYAGIPVTMREAASSVTFVTGHEAASGERSVNWKALAESGTTLVVYMGMSRVGEWTGELMRAGMDPQTPAAVVQWGTTLRQRSLRSTLAGLDQAVRDSGIGAPAVVVVGKVAAEQVTPPWWEQRPLYGISILATCSRAQTARLRDIWEPMGAEVMNWPALDIFPFQQAGATAPDMQGWDWIVWTSANAVRRSFEEWASRGQGDLRALAGVKLAVVGDATGRTLAEHGLRADWMPRRSNAGGLVEEWSDTRPSLNILFPCGRQARNTLEKGLAGLGHHVRRWEIYETRAPDESDAQSLRQRLERQPRWLVFTSSGAVDTFFERGGSVAAGMNIASIGPTTTTTLRQHGCQHTHEPPAPSLEGLAQMLVDVTLNKSK